MRLLASSPYGVMHLQIAALGGMAIIVAQPSYGLSKITTDAANTFASIIKGYEQQGASMLIEFGHEMNGNWNQWGQQPAEYIKAFQTMSTAISKVWLANCIACACTLCTLRFLHLGCTSCTWWCRVALTMHDACDFSASHANSVKAHLGCMFLYVAFTVCHTPPAR